MSFDDEFPHVARALDGEPLVPDTAENVALTEAELDYLACRCHVSICPIHNEASDGNIEYQADRLIHVVEQIVAARMAPVVALASEWATHTDDPRAYPAARILDAIRTTVTPPGEQ